MKRKRGRPKIEFDEAVATSVRALSSYGVPIEDIANYVEMSEDTMRKLYSEEIRRGRKAADILLRRTLFKQAVEEKNTACLIFLCKTRLGMKETSVVDHKSTDGTMSPKTKLNIDIEKMTPEDLDKMYEKVFGNEKTDNQ